MHKFSAVFVLGLGLTVAVSPAFSAGTLLCPDQASTAGGNNDTVTPFAGIPACGADSGETLQIGNDTDYAKLTWTDLPAGLTLGNLTGLNALVSFTAGQSTDSPYFELEVTDPSDALGEVPGDPVLLLEFQSLGISGAGFVNMTFNPASTPITVFDNGAPQSYLLGGQHSAGSPTTLDALLTAYPVISGDQITQIRLAIGLAGPGCDSNCAESLSVDSAEITPEPGTVALLFTGLAGIVGWRRRMSRSPVIR